MLSAEARKSTKGLLDALLPDVRALVQMRIAAMERELRYLRESESRHLTTIQSNGWSTDKLYVALVLNSVYQHVLAPQVAGSAEGPSGLGRQTPVHHGSQRFDSGSAHRIRAAMEDFNLLLSELHIPSLVLEENTCGDIVYRLSRIYHGEEAFDEPD